MENRYKVIVSNKFFYKEIELAPDAQRLTLGTGLDCDVRLYKNQFFEPIQLSFEKSGSAWTVTCADNLYLTVGDARKLYTMHLEHGDRLLIKYQQSDNPVFTVEFLIDFDDGKRKYERSISISGRSVVSIGGGANQDIVLGSSYGAQESVSLSREREGYVLRIYRTRYGVYHNGIKVEKDERIENGDFISLADFFFYLKDDTLWTEIRGDLIVRGLPSADHPSRDGYPLFKRNTRIKTVFNKDKIEILDPPAMPNKPKENIFLRLLPSMGMLLAAGAMAMSGSGMILFSLISGGIAVLTTVLTFFSTKKEYREGVENRYQMYTAYAANKRQEIQQIREQERQELEREYIDQNHEQARVVSFSSNLFDRRLKDEDFLCVRLGSGMVPAIREIEYKKQEKLEPEDALQMIPAQMSQEFKMIQNAPVICDLKKTDAVGIYGQEAFRLATMKNMVVDIAARQFFSDVKLFFVAREENKDKIFWLRMLPHVMDHGTGVRGIVCNDESKNTVFEYLYKELTRREQAKSFDSRIVVFFYDEYGFNSHPISKFVGKARALGVTLIFFGEKKSDIPQGCGYLVELRDARSGVLVDTQDVNQSVAFNYPTISDENARRIVDILAPVYTEEISLESTLVKNVSLFELLNIIAVDDMDLGRRWGDSQVFKSMAAPIGVSKTGTVYLDLHDKAHGPHGLVAGTTGSGKSELLQTYILSMATLFHPYEVAFVIIDFKGGGMVNQFKDLPHLLGAITNIDGKEIDRSLKSIKAELQKRQRLFAQADVNHIDKYIRKYKAGEVQEPLPHLIIIVDEFAELKAEQPEFMKELISAARIGRSLGVHLILATQKPSGQVNEQIWSNSRFKLCLKVQSQEDSNEVLKSPLAAEIKEPGRAYLQVGNNEIFELFQSAYSGAPEKMDDSNIKEFSVFSLSESGKRTPVFVQKKTKGTRGSATQLNAIVDYVNRYCQKNTIAKLPDICLPALRQSIPYERNHVEKDPCRTEVSIGIYDNPDMQYQGDYSINLTSSNVMVIGSARSGKTNLLETMIHGLADRYTPDEVTIYIIDFASMFLKNFETMNHVGGVVTSSEDEKLKNLFKLIFTEMEERKKKMLEYGVSSFAAYREAGKTDLPQIVLMIDNLSALKELYMEDDSELLTLCREGLTVGISVVVANSHTTGIGYKYLASFSTRIAFFCNDSNEYISLFESCREKVPNIPGRCLIEIEKQFMDCQVFLAFQGEKEIERVNAIRDFLSECNKKYRGRRRAIPEIPENLSDTYVAENLDGYMGENYSVVIGLDYGTISPVVLQLNSVGALGISGREKSGKHNFIRYIISMMNRIYPGQTEVYVFDSINRRLASLQSNENVIQYSILAGGAPQAVKEIEEKLKARYNAIASGEEDLLEYAPLLVLVLNSMDAVEAVCSDMKALEAYKNIVGKYRNLNVCVLVGGIENAMISYNSPEILKRLKETKHFIFFEDLANLKLVDLPLQTMKQFKKPISLGDGYYMRDTSCVKIKTPFLK